MLSSDSSNMAIYHTEHKDYQDLDSLILNEASVYTLVSMFYDTIKFIQVDY